MRAKFNVGWLIESSIVAVLIIPVLALFFYDTGDLPDIWAIITKLIH